MIFIRVIDFPRGKTKACCTETPEGDLIVFVDAHRSRREQIKAVLHEIRHKYDFDKTDVQEIERDAHT